MGVVLLDSHVLLWAAGSPDLLSEKARDLIRDPDTIVLVSSATAWELAIKYYVGKLPAAGRIVQDFYGILARLKFQSLDITPLHALTAAKLSHPHRDPFDRMLIAQSMLEQIVLVSADEVIQSFPDVQWFW